jgi:hypothetical protein
METTESARKASESDNFPCASRLLCFFAVVKGKPPVQLHYVADRREAVRRARTRRDTVIYAVWPGNHRSDLFVIDKLAPLAKAWRVDETNNHLGNHR